MIVFYSVNYKLQRRSPFCPQVTSQHEQTAAHAIQQAFPNAAAARNVLHGVQDYHATISET